MAIKYRAGHEADYNGTPWSTYDGAVLSTGHFKSVRVMSDVWGTEYFAKVWNGERIAEIATSLHDDMGNRVWADATVDATPEAIAAARTWRIAEEAKLAEYRWSNAADKVINEAERVTRGKEVVVARGRKVAKGTKGEVIWVGMSKGKWPSIRAGVKDAAGTVHWTAVSNLDVIDPLDYVNDYDAEFLSKPTAAKFLADAEKTIDREDAALAPRKAA